MSRVFKLIAVSVSLLAWAQAAQAADTDFASWLNGVRQDAIASGLQPQSVDLALQGVAPIPRVIELDQSQPESTLTFDQYVERVVNPKRIALGRRKLAENRTLLAKIARRYRVQPRFIVALWGIETDFGAQTGGFPALSALATLAYDGRRSAFFRRELIAAIRIVDRDHIPPGEMTGSWAGAMGQCQFMPTTYLEHAASYRGKGSPDIWQQSPDALASIAKYLADLGWNDKESWGRAVQVPPGFDTSLAGLPQSKPLREWRLLGIRRKDGGKLPALDRPAALLLPDGAGGSGLLVYDNFRTLLKWNASSYFAAAVGFLADSLQ